MSGNDLYSTKCVGRSDEGRNFPARILPFKSDTTRCSGFILLYGTPLGLITTKAFSRSIPLALPKVYSTRPRRTNSRLASSTSSRNCFSEDLDNLAWCLGTSAALQNLRTFPAPLAD